MLKHKRTLAGILAATMMLSMAACGGGGSQKDGDVAEGPQDPNAAAAAGTLELTDWEKSSGIFNTDETDEELYEKAKEEGKVTVYSISSRVTKVAKAFEEKYPGVTVEPFDISTNELLEKVTREYDAGQHVADVGQRLAGLLFNTLRESARGGIKRKLAGRNDQLTCCNTLCIGADRCRCLFRTDDLLHFHQPPFHVINFITLKTFCQRLIVHFV